MTMQNKYGLAAAKTQIGFGHVRRGTPCEDASLAAELKRGFFIAVSDGHGGADYPRSREGSRLACDLAYTLALQYEERGIGDTDAAADYAHEVLAAWLAKVRELAAETPVTEEEYAAVSARARAQYEAGERLEKLYGCTLLCALCFSEKCVFVQIGDGDSLALRRTKHFFVPVAEDESCQFNVTSSLCGTDAEEKLRVAVVEEPLWGVFLCSDGVSNSFQSREYLAKFFQRITLSFLEAEKQPQEATDSAQEVTEADEVPEPENGEGEEAEPEQIEADGEQTFTDAVAMPESESGAQEPDTADGPQAADPGVAPEQESADADAPQQEPVDEAMTPVEAAAAKLQSFLARLSQEGSGDDVSVALCLLNEPQPEEPEEPETPDRPDEPEDSPAELGGADEPDEEPEEEPDDPDTPEEQQKEKDEEGSGWLSRLKHWFLG